MEFRKNDPGAVQFGNFINYYQFNSAEERLKLLSKDIWIPTEDVSTINHDPSPYLVLDVGCNSGVFTQLMYKFLVSNVQKATKKQIFILGIDIDNSLIQKAIEENKYPNNVSYQCVMDKNNFENVITAYLNQYSLNKCFDVVLCFSITMWIHLNHDDLGLQQFLTNLSTIAKLFVVEPQPWKCYQTAERRLKKTGEEFPLFLKLKWRSNVEQEIQTYLEESLKRQKVNECDPTKWKRRICFYR